jgi:thiamine transport system substrate-binding protein
MVLSYTTSPAYHVEFEDTTRFRAAMFEEGLYRQIEGVGIVAGTANRSTAEDFIDFVLSDAFQSEIPLTNWMYPVTDVELPESYTYAPRPNTRVTFDPESVEGGVDAVIEDWLAVFGR